MNSTTLTLSLLEFLAWRAGCQYLSDLHFLDGWQRTLLARAVREIHPENACLHEWNDALEYLAHAPPETTVQEAPAKLVKLLMSGHKNKGVENG